MDTLLDDLADAIRADYKPRRRIDYTSIANAIARNFTMGVAIGVGVAVGMTIAG